MIRVQAVLVLYRTSLAESPTLRTLQPLLEGYPEFASRFSLLLADNSPHAQPLPPNLPFRSLPFVYLHDGRNPGLAERYNQALASAAESNATWLLLLDQDTTLTAEWIVELDRLSRELADDARVGAIVPRLVTRTASGDRLESPHAPSFQPNAMPFDPQAPAGLIPGLIRAYNSAALLRVSALQQLGGFPTQYPLDYLDHAVFHQLQTVVGSRIFVMQSALQHDMSIYREDLRDDPLHAVRHAGQLAAQLRFYREHGSPVERHAHRLHLLREAVQTAQRGHLADAGRLLRAALSTSVPA